APAENLLDAADRARLGAAEGQLRTALAAHPGLVDAVRRLRADRDAFDRIWEAHTTVRNGRTSPAPQPASDRPPVARTAAPARPRRRAAPVWRYGAVLAYVARRDAGFDTLRAAEAMAVELPDGSAVELAPGAVLQVAEEADVREARLLAGNALFAIRHDPADPFTVETPNAVVTVLGTTFGVAVDEAATEVVLVQGAVALASKGEAEAAVELAPGQRSRVVALDAPAAPAP